MRSASALLLLSLGIAAPLAAQTPTTCTGLCLQQVSCPAGGTTSISGTVYAPNGTDPLPNVLVYIPNAPVDAFTPGVTCPLVGQPPSGSPLVGATTAVDGTFTIPNVPVGSNIPLVIISGRWRRQFVVPTTTACANTPLPDKTINFPINQSQGDIPKFAIATGSADQVECVLLKVGIDPAEFTDPTGIGRVNLYTGSAGPGASLNGSTAQQTETTLMGSSATLNGYDVLMLPCEGTPGPASKTTAEYANLVAFANAGGRVYASHYSYQWMEQASTFASVANWLNSGAAVGDGLPATVNTTFSDGTTLAQWLSIVGAASSTNPTVISLSQVKHDINGVNAATTQSYLTLNQAVGTDNKPVEQFVWNAPLATPGVTPNQCGRVLFNEYHVETASPAKGFPAECNLTAAITPQEKLLEYSLFELTNNGASATLTPATQDFGSVAIGFSSAPFTFVWTNNSTFPGGVTSLTTTGDFAVTGNNCTVVAAGASCNITVVFTPVALGARSGVLTVGSSGSTLIATLTGTGVPALTFTPTSLAFGSIDVGATSAAQSVSVTNNASGAIAIPKFVTTGPFAVTIDTCPASLAAGATCSASITFTPTTTGPQTGTLAFNSTGASYSGTLGSLTGNGVDFTVAVTPTSGTVIAGDAVTASALFSPLAGFAAPVTATCITNAPGATCTLGSVNFVPNPAVTTSVKISTTSQYTVIGYTGGFGGTGYLWLVGLGTASLLFFTRRRGTSLLRAGLLVITLGIFALSTSGCSGKIPAQNAVYTAAGSYGFTISATDGFLIHSQTYTLTVTAK